MRKPVLLIFINALILVVVCSLMGQSLFVVQRLAQAQGVQGHVEVQRQGRGAFFPLVSNQTVAVNDVVRTGSTGEVEFAWADRTRWKLTPNTTLKVQQASMNSMKAVESAHFVLESGKMFVRVAKLLPSASRFEIETPSAIASVHSAVFSIAIEGRQTHIEVWKGKVQFSDRNGESQSVGDAQQATGGAGCIQVSVAPKVTSTLPPELMRPELEAEMQMISGSKAVLRGSTEAGDRVRINNRVVRTLGNGTFFASIDLTPGHNEWNIQSTDRHGGSTSVCRALDFDATTQKAQDSECGIQ